MCGDANKNPAYLETLTVRIKKISPPQVQGPHLGADLRKTRSYFKTYF
jgi:hypothetical protein